MNRPRLATGARVRYDDVREQHVLLVPEGVVRLNPTAARPFTLVAELSHQFPLHCPYCSNPLDIGRDAYRREPETEHWLRAFREARALGVRGSGAPTGCRSPADRVRSGTRRRTSAAAAARRWR